MVTLVYNSMSLNREPLQPKKQGMRIHNNMKLLSPFKNVLPIILILQLLITGSALSLGSSSNHLYLNDNTGSSSHTSPYTDDLEYQAVDPYLKSSHFISYRNNKLTSSSADLPSSYYFCKLNSRSPPGSMLLESRLNGNSC